ncbi:MOSC domain-containing protein [Asticcacaulis sp. ZE23SCel15]|uniref:MOSC domain-containing protein n=1 Tax=Asticcacaulis sp. ZE23SCel15 TaxID=3059027 RepID=UPI00265D68A9|nr:MOSC domain-containing protein [Asticcacaulis sp. ZE23SCel15]WKL56946.1 MOSC domain-containing protein [Asticcacaulis sp. ZE23SCel15]
MAFNRSSPLAQLMQAPVRLGRVEWIGIRPARRAAMLTPERIELNPQDGIIGDRYHSKTTGNRHVTLIQSEHLLAIASYLGRDQIAPEDLRRNIVVSGLNLLALKDREFHLGSAVLKMTGDCHPCSRMEETFGEGGYNAVRGHGGITARVIVAGNVSIGDAIFPVEAPLL